MSSTDKKSKLGYVHFKSLCTFMSTSYYDSLLILKYAYISNIYLFYCIVSISAAFFCKYMFNIL